MAMCQLTYLSTGQPSSGASLSHNWICVTGQIDTKKKLAINAMPTAHTSERNIAQSAR